MHVLSITVVVGNFRELKEEVCIRRYVMVDVSAKNICIYTVAM